MIRCITIRRAKYQAGLRHCAGVVLAAIALLGVPAYAAQSYPRADAAATAQHFAVTMDQSLGGVMPLVPTLFGLRGEVVAEWWLGNVFRAIDAYAFAEGRLLRAQRAALGVGNTTDAADILVARGEIALLRGDYTHAEGLSHELVQLAQREHLFWAEASAEEYLGVLDRRHGKLDDAVAHEQRALDLQRSLNDPNGIATALTNLGTIARDRGDYAQALDLHLQANAIRERIEVRLELTLRNLALIYRDLGDDAATRSYFDRALAVARRHGDTSNYAATLGTYAGYLADVREFAPALAAADEALALGRATGNRPSTAFSLLDGGRALLGLGSVDEASTRLGAALALGRELDQHEIMARSLVALAEVALIKGDRAQVRRLLDETFASAQASESKPLLVQAYALREKLASADHDSAGALGFAHQQAALREDLLGTRASRRLSALESQYARAASEQKLVLVTKDNQLQTVHLQEDELRRNYGLAAMAGLLAVLALLLWRFIGVHRLNNALSLRNAEIEAKRAALSEANQRLEHQAEQLYHAAITDPLTGVFNRGHLMRQLDALVGDCVHDHRELAVLLIDFDHFKQLNDARGHLFGDRVLVGGVQTLRQWLEPGDLLGRYGGEEFIAAIPGRDLPEVRMRADRLRVRVAETLSTFAPELKSIATISIGVAMLSQLPKPVRLESLIEAADKAVYKAKANGRNQVMSFAA
jgi:diguanylate cyclase (GGDEF)-like protein